MGGLVITVAGVPTGRSLARRPPAAAGMVARPGDNLRLPLAMLVSPAGFLRTDVRVHHKVTRLPQSGCSHRALTTHSSHAQSQQCRHSIPGVKELQLKPGGYNI